MRYSDAIRSEQELEELLSTPSPARIEMMKRLDGDLMILGIAGKMGLTMGRRAARAIELAGVKKKVVGVSRFSKPADREKLEAWGIETIPCDLLDREQVRKLPRVANVVFMAGRKFGTDGSEELTWAMNTLVPGNVVEHFKASRIVAFSTGCVYPLVGPETGGCTEAVLPAPVGEYSQSCLGRERIFQHGAKAFGTKVLLFRLNYAIDLRYGVLHDIARQVWNNEPVTDSVGHFNVIWQGDANDAALRSLELAASPAAVLNVTGPETASLRSIAEQLGKLMGREVRYAHDGLGSGSCYLNNAAKMADLFGYPSVPLARMIRWQAEWFKNGGSSLGKPTHFEVNNGKF